MFHMLFPYLKTLIIALVGGTIGVLFSISLRRIFVVKENMIVGDYQLVVGVPAKIIKTLKSSTYDENVKWAKKYVQLANIHKNHN